MKVNIRLILSNIVLTVVFILGLNFLSNVVLGLTAKNSRARTIADLEAEKIANLPNYLNQRDLALQNFQELNQVRTEYQAFVGWSSKPFQGKTINIDSHGDRVHHNKVFGKDSHKLAYLLGGSTVWGWGAVNEQTIPAVFNSISGIPTFNKGQIGFSSRQSLAQLIEMIQSEPKIDVVIFYDGVNDVIHLCRAENNVNDHAMSAHIKGKLEAKPQPQTPKFLQYLEIMFIRGTKTLVDRASRQVVQQAALKNESMHDESMDCDNNREKARQIAERMVKNWEIARELTESRGILFRAILQPVAFIGEPKLDHLPDLELPAQKEIAKQYKTVYPMVQEIIQKRGHDWLLDYTEMYSRDEYIYIDLCHVSGNGNSIIAQQLYSDIKSALD